MTAAYDTASYVAVICSRHIPVSYAAYDIINMISYRKYDTIWTATYDMS